MVAIPETAHKPTGGCSRRRIEMARAHLQTDSKAIFGGLGGPIRGLLEQHFASDAEQLRDIPVGPVLALADRYYRVFQGAESIVEPAVPCAGSAPNRPRGAMVMDTRSCRLRLSCAMMELMGSPGWLEGEVRSAALSLL
jgi:hypothetical protein